MKSLFLIVALACVCLTANASILRNEIPTNDNLDLYSDIERGLVDDMVKAAKEALQKVIDIITKNLSEPIKNITDLQVQLKKIYDETLAYIKQFYAEQEQKYINDVNKVVDCYKTEANKLGISLKECADKTANQLLAVPESFIKNLTQCATNEFDSGMAIVNQAMDIYNSVVKDVSDFPKKITDCTKLSFMSAISCLGGVTADVASLATKVPSYIAKVTSLATDLTTFAGGMKARIIACGSIKTAGVGINCAGITTDFLTCAKKKFPNPVSCLNTNSIFV